MALFCIHCSQLVLRKISKIGATRCQILRLKCTKFDFRWDSAPDPLAVFKGPISKGREWKEGGVGKGREREGEGREGKWRGLPLNWGVWIRQWERIKERGGRRGKRGREGETRLPILQCWQFFWILPY